jgi:hypothetical protein
MPICTFIDCKKDAFYNFKNESSAIYCTMHKKVDMIDVRHRLCIFTDCYKRASFNLKNELFGEYCSTHKKDGMIDVINRKCNEADCNTQPRYNYKNENKGLYCSKHKKNGMIDIYENYCTAKDCVTRATFNYKNESKGIYCSKHKKDNMINVKTKVCYVKDCRIQPVFNFPNYKRGKYCKYHKLDGMIDVKNMKCNEHNCNKRASFGCSKNKIPLYCTLHKKEDMIDVRHKTCLVELCDTIVTNKYNGYCIRCFIHLFPDEPVSCNYKTKEKAVLDYILENFKDKTIITDKKVYDGCSQKRPDIFIDLGYQVIIVEIDENQHKNYSCENKRIMELSQDINHRPLIIIRFNPDEFIDSKNNSITSCWGINKKGICSIKRNKVKEWNERLMTLKQTIEYWLKNETTKTIELVYLYYNNIVE